MFAPKERPKSLWLQHRGNERSCRTSTSLVIKGSDTPKCASKNAARGQLGKDELLISEIHRM